MRDKDTPEHKNEVKPFTHIVNFQRSSTRIKAIVQSACLTVAVFVSVVPDSDLCKSRRRVS